MQGKLYQLIARTIEARLNCIKRGNAEWQGKHEDVIEILESLLPSGSGIDSGTRIDLEKSKPDRIVLATAFHHMSDVGYYDGWTYHAVVITPSLAHGMDLRVTGRDRNEIKDYLSDLFRESLACECVVSLPTEKSTEISGAV